MKRWWSASDLETIWYEMRKPHYNMRKNFGDHVWKMYAQYAVERLRRSTGGFAALRRLRRLYVTIWELKD